MFKSGVTINYNKLHVFKFFTTTDWNLGTVGNVRLQSILYSLMLHTSILSRRPIEDQTSGDTYTSWPPVPFKSSLASEYHTFPTLTLISRKAPRKSPYVDQRSASHH
jgi:hypothetical protein